MHVNTLILGAGAAGMMAAAHAGPDTLVIDHAKAAGEKIRISGGGRCNFTNTGATPGQFLSQNPHFCKSALSRYTQWDFISLVSDHGIAWHEKTEVSHDGTHFRVRLTQDGKSKTITATNLILATGGKSIPKMGATGLAYQIAQQFGLNIITPRPGLVPLTFSDDKFKPLAGVATPARVTANGTSFDEALLFTHRGLSGPAVLQASSFWQEGEAISVNLIPSNTLLDHLKAARTRDGRKALSSILAQHLPTRLIDFLKDDLQLSGNIADQSDARLQSICDALSEWPLLPSGSEGYRTAEVTLGGIDTNDLSSKTMEAKHIPGLYIIGEAVDVTGWLGGYNFQWAWSSGWAAGQAIMAKRG